MNKVSIRLIVEKSDYHGEDNSQETRTAELEFESSEIYIIAAIFSDLCREHLSEIVITPGTIENDAPTEPTA